VLVGLAKTFERFRDWDKQDRMGELKVTLKSKNGCKVALANQHYAFNANLPPHGGFNMGSNALFELPRPFGHRDVG
jgi:hypothetical protein